MPTQIVSTVVMGIAVLLLYVLAGPNLIPWTSGTEASRIFAAESAGFSAPRALVNWSSPAGGYFDVGANWSTGTAPGINDSASFAIDDVYSVDWDSITGDIVSDDLFVLNGEVTLRSLGSGGGGPVYDYTLNDDVTVGFGAFLKVGDGTDGLNLIVGGDLLVDNGNMKVSRLGSLQANGPINIASSDNTAGFLNFQDAPFDSTGLICVGIGSNAKGRIVVAGGSTANTTNVDIGCSPTTIYGRLEVVGESSVWNSTTELDIGHTGSGVMVVRLGGIVNSNISAIGWQPGSSGQVTVKHSGSQWNIVNGLDLGANPNTFGTLLIQEGGEVATGNFDIRIGSVTNLPGCEAIVEDQDSLLSSARDIYVGGISTGTLTVQDGANIFANGSMFVRPNGLVNVAGFGFPAIDVAQIENEGLMSLSAATPDIFASVVNTGTIESIDGAVSWIYEDLQHDGIEVRTQLGSETRIIGQISGEGPFTGQGLVEFFGIIEPGSLSGILDTGTITVAGDLNLSSSTVSQFEISGASAAQFDRLLVDGNVTVDGTLNFFQLSSFVPSAGDVFVFVKVGGTRTGQFSGPPEGALAGNVGGVNLFITYVGGDGNDIALTTIGGVLLGDVNLDGVVNLLDVAPFVNRITTGTYQAEADVNEDGAVNLLDVGPFVAILTGP